MTTITKLLSSHADTLVPKYADAARDLERRIAARHAFARPAGLTDLEAQTAFIRIDRAFSDRPVHLFGQDVPSLAHSIISIMRGDEILISAAISEKALTEAVLHSNRGEGLPLTPTKLGDFMVPERGALPTKADRTAFAADARQKESLKESLSTIKAVLATNPKKPTADLKGAAEALSYRARDLADTGYAMNRHLEEMTSMRTELLTEAAHAALHAQKVSDALARGSTALPAPMPADWTEEARTHPLLDHTLDTLSSELKEAIRCLLVAEIRSLSDQHPDIVKWISFENGTERVRFPDHKGLRAPLGYSQKSADTLTWVQELANLSNWAFNPHIASSRELYDASQGSIRLSRRTGWIGNIHSSVPPTDGDYFSISISGAYEDQDIGNTRVRSRSSATIEIEMVSEDFMTALRGHPGGISVPCSIRHLCGVSMPLVERVAHELSEDLDDLSKSLSSSAEIMELNRAIKALNDLATAKRSGSAWLAELRSSLETVELAFDHAEAMVEKHMAEGRSCINRNIAQSASEILTSISDSLPIEVLDLLKIRKS
jgi:hypothetical protein